MIPLPGSPASSWAMFSARVRAVFQGAAPRICAAFWLFGLINNVLYVIILSAALDLVGPSVPKGVVLLCDVIPSFLTKLLAPYFIHVIPYPVRVMLFSLVSAGGMLLIALSPGHTDEGSMSIKMAGVVLASLSSGGGELSFISLTHFYGPFSLAAWSSGTGGAGLIGAGAYTLATTSFGLSSKKTLLASAFLPIIMLVSFFLVLPREPLKWDQVHVHAGKSDHRTVADGDDDNEQYRVHESEGLLRDPENRSASPSPSIRKNQQWTASFLQNLRHSRSLFFPFMLPLLLVYIAEYTINQGVAPTLLFPLASTPFRHYRAFYPTYNAIYQSGVFISRSSTPFVRIHNLYLPALLQVLNLALLIAQSLVSFLPSVYIVFGIIFWEGLLGGAVYVNTFAEISDKIAKEEREFSLGAVTVSDSGGICVAGFIAMVLEVVLCNRQVLGGKDWCTQE